MPGLESAEHRARMREEVDKARQHLKDFAWSCGVRNTKVMNPGRASMDSSALDEDEDRHLWMDDPVPLSATVYDVIARMITEQANSFKGPNH